MKLFKLTSGKLVDQCASELASEFSRLCPLPEKQTGRPLSERSVERALKEVYGRAKAFRDGNRLGIFNRARLARVFQQELARRGYAPELVTKVTTSLVATALTGD
jgi:hypothetical protein